MAAERDLLQLLANPTNRAILQMLFVEPQYPRRLAELVGLTEDETSRRLRTFEKLGVAEATWANVGKNVRLYRLAATRFSIELGAAGIRVAGVSGAEVPMPTVAEPIPETPRFVGRDRELRELDSLLANGRAACITGIGGTGKTTVAAAWARRRRTPVAWHTVAPGESGPLLLAGLASALRAIDAPDQVRRLASLRGADETGTLAPAIAERLNSLGATAVLDRFEAANEEAVAVAAVIARSLTSGRLLLTSRVFPRGLPRDAVARYPLGGFDADGTSRLLAALGSGGESAAAVHRATGGHPLSVVLTAPLVAQGAPGDSIPRLGQEAGIQAFLFEELLPQLSEGERDVLLSLSVLRLPFTAEEAEAVAGAKHTVHALLRLEARSLVGRAGDRYFLHDLVRTYAAESVPERRAVHARAAKALLAAKEPKKALEAIHHFLEAGQPAAAAAIVRDEAERRTYRFAEMGLAEAYLEAVDAMARRVDLDARLRAAVELECGSTLTHLGQAEPARVQLEAAERHMEDALDKESLRVPFQFALARLRRVEGDHAAAAVLYAKVERAAQAAGDKASLLEALVEHAFDEEMISDRSALAIYEQAIALAPGASDPRLLSLAFAGASRVAERWKDPRFAQWSDHALELARVAGYLRGEASVCANLASHHVLAGTPGLALEYAERYIDVANRLGDPWLRCCALTGMAFLRISQDRATAALQEADACAVLARSIRSPFFELASALAGAEALVALGKPGDALLRLEPRLGPAYRTFPGLLERSWRTAAQAHRILGNLPAAQRAERRSDRLRKRHGLSTAPTAIFVAVRPMQAPAIKPRPRRAGRTAPARFSFECPQCGQVQPYARLPRVPPECCGNLMRPLAAPAGN